MEVVVVAAVALAPEGPVVVAVASVAQATVAVADAKVQEMLPNPKSPIPFLLLLLKEGQTFSKTEGIFREFIYNHEFPGNFQIPI